MTKNYIGLASQLEEGSRGIRFEVENNAGEKLPAFLIKFESRYYAYLNRCGHIAVQLDYREGEFFSDEGKTLMCSTHGAEYAPDSGACLGGPCFGIGLKALEISQINDEIFLSDKKYNVVEPVD